MSKFIRTKDGIFEVEKIEKYFLDESQKLFINNTMRIAFKENEVLKQADTIEELCDRFVTVVNDKGKVYHFTDYTFENVKNDRDNEVFGAIWTDKGLIYVAKMDAEGKLILL